MVSGAYDLWLSAASKPVCRSYLPSAP